MGGKEQRPEPPFLKKNPQFVDSLNNKPHKNHHHYHHRYQESSPWRDSLW